MVHKYTSNMRAESNALLVERQAGIDSLSSPYSSYSLVASNDLHVEPVLQKDVRSYQACRPSTDDTNSLDRGVRCVGHWRTKVSWLRSCSEVKEGL